MCFTALGKKDVIWKRLLFLMHHRFGRTIPVVKNVKTFRTVFHRFAGL